MKLSQPLWLLGFLLCLSSCDGPKPAAEEPSASTPGNQPVATKECHLVMGWDPWAPYQYEIAGGRVFGLDVDLISAVSAQTGCTLSFQKGTWSTLLESLKTGEVDLLAGATQTPERLDFARFTSPYRTEEFYLYLPVEQGPALTDQSLVSMLAGGARIGVVDSYIYGPAITALQDAPELGQQFHYAAMAETNFSRLLDGAVDALIEDRYVGAAIIRHKNLGERIARGDTHLTSSPVRIMVSRESVDENTFQALEASVLELRANGAIDKVLSLYGEP